MNEENNSALEQQVMQLQQENAKLQAELAAVLKNKNEILDEKKQLQQKLQTDYILKTELENVPSNEVKRLEMEVQRLAEKLDTAERQAKERETKLKEKTLKGSVLQTFSDAAVRPDEFATLLIDGYKVLKIADNGDAVVQWEGKELSLKDFKEIALKEKSLSHHFKSTAVSGTGVNYSGSGTSTSTKDNPWAKDNWNFTKQMEILKKDPERAKQLQKAAKG